ITICQVQTIDGARDAVAAGAHVLVAQCNESGGHTGATHLLPFRVRGIEMVPELPVVAAGGIASGRALAAVLAAGAEGAWVGTAFVATPENELPEAYKALVVQSDGAESGAA